VVLVDTDLSKTLSYFLRHEPEEGNLSMDEQGYVSAEELVTVLRDRKWPDVTAEQLLETVEDPDVERFERLGDRIRASYGHSVDVTLEHPEIRPPDELYHGTSRSAWESIREEGLKPMGRQYVHLSRTVEEARRVGHRHDSSPVILTVHPDETSSHDFWKAGPVVLTDFVPPDWIERRKGD
jgi:putative RNA 2'-phosphotransferase